MKKNEVLLVGGPFDGCVGDGVDVELLSHPGVGWLFPDTDAKQMAAYESTGEEREERLVLKFRAYTGVVHTEPWTEEVYTGDNE